LAKKRKAVNRRKPTSGGSRPLLAVLIVVLLISAAFFLLERSRSFAPPAKVETGAGTSQHLPLPERPPVQQVLSSVQVPVPQPHPATAPRQNESARIAIVIDDMGSSMEQLQTLLSIELPLTYAVIPGLAHAKRVAETAHKAGAEVMVHMPMEPEGYPQQRLESNGLLLAMDDAEIVKRVNGYFNTVPFAAGANNHMGSRFTQSAEKMEVVLKVLKGKGVFFVDSRTSPASAGYKTARSLGLSCATRQVFLDNVQDDAAIGKQLDEAVAIARKRGAAIAICHPHPSTLRVLKALMPELSRSGITFVYASALTS